MENSVLCQSKKKQARESYGYSETLENHWENKVLSSVEGSCQEKKRCGPLQRAQESQRHIMESIGFCMSGQMEHGAFS